MGLFQVGSPAGYPSGCALYLRTRPGIVKAADFPSPVAVQQRIIRPSRTAETSSSRPRCRPSIDVGIMFFTMFCTVSRPRGSCQRAPVAIFVGSIHSRSKSNQVSRRIIGECRVDNEGTGDILTRRGFKVRRLHNNFLTRFGGRDMKQTTYTREPYKSTKFTCIVVCLRETSNWVPPVIASKLNPYKTRHPGKRP